MAIETAMKIGNMQTVQRTLAPTALDEKFGEMSSLRNREPSSNESRATSHIQVKQTLASQSVST